MNHTSGNVIFASLFTGIFDVNRNELLAPDDFQIIQKWCESIQNLNLNGVIFHNNFSEKSIKQTNSKHIQFVKVDFDKRLNPNVYRYLVYLDFLKKNQDSIQGLFMTDIADVEVVKNPFEELLFTQQPAHLFCGDEEEILNNSWMIDHCTHLRKTVPGFMKFEKENESQTLLNCGVIGGHTGVIIPFLELLSQIHLKYTISNQSPYTLDMGAFNFIARTYFEERLIHGYPVNTRFKSYESTRADCWFRHK